MFSEKWLRALQIVTIASALVTATAFGSITYIDARAQCAPHGPCDTTHIWTVSVLTGLIAIAILGLVAAPLLTATFWFIGQPPSQRKAFTKADRNEVLAINYRLSLSITCIVITAATLVSWLT